MIAVVPLLPVLFPLMTLIGWTLLSVATLLGLAGNQERRKMLLRFLWKQKYSLAIIGATLSLTWYGLSELFARWSRLPGVPVAIQAGEAWPMFRGGPDRTGVVTRGNRKLTNQSLWSGGLQDSFFASPTVVGNRVYCIGSDGDSGRILCWHDMSGELQWVERPLDMRATFSSPVVAGNYLLCGEGLHKTENARIYCLDISNADRPNLHWSFTTRSHVECTPVVVDDRVYVAAGDDGVYSLSLSLQESQRPKVHWQVPGELLPDVETSLIADRESVYVGTGTGGHNLVILNAATGVETARIPFDYPLHAPPALVNQRLYVGMGHGNFVESPEVSGGAVACIDTQAAQVLWNYSTPATVLGAITVSQGEVLFCCADGLVRCLSLEGHPLHSWDSGAAIKTSLAVTPEEICGVNDHGRLFVLDRKSWSVSWDRFLGRDGYFISSPAISDGRIYIGTEKYGLQCFGQGSSE